MVLPVVRQATDAVVTVPEDLDPQLVVFLKGQSVVCAPGPWPWRRGTAGAGRPGRDSLGARDGAEGRRPREREWALLGLTAASLSKRAKSSLRSFTSSWALQAEDSWVKPTMSANRMLQKDRATGSEAPDSDSPPTAARRDRGGPGRAWAAKLILCKGPACRLPPLQPPPLRLLTPSCPGLRGSGGCQGLFSE